MKREDFEKLFSRTKSVTTEPTTAVETSKLTGDVKATTAKNPAMSVEPEMHCEVSETEVSVVLEWQFNYRYSHVKVSGYVRKKFDGDVNVVGPLRQQLTRIHREVKDYFRQEAETVLKNWGDLQQ